MDDARRILRKRLRELRAAIPASIRIAAADAVAENLMRLPAVRGANTIAGYWSVGGELPLHSLMARLPRRMQYCLPMLQPDRTLRFAPWHVGDAVVANRYGIPEPAHPVSMLDPRALDIVLLPLLGYTRGGNRLGTGGGWYDRSFAFRHEAPAPPLLVGVGFACQQIGADPQVSLPAQDWDVPLDAIVTERELIVCTR